MPKGRARLAVAGGLVVALVLFLTGIYAFVAPSQAAGAQSTLTILTGDVTIKTGAADGFSPANDGSLLDPGTTIRTGNGANAVVTFFDGSTVTIEPDSELTLDQVEATSRGDVIIAMTQNIGKTWHVIAHKLTGASSYKLKTPQATASVRGTAFRSAVNEHFTGLETVDGVVQANLAGATDPVNIGEGQVCPLGHKLDGSELPADATPPPSFPATPLPAPPPPALAKVVIDPSQAQSALVTTKEGLSVGVTNVAGVGAVPLRYVPGSQVKKVGDKIEIWVPMNEPGRLSTSVQAFDRTKPVEIQTQIESQGEIRAITTEVRQPDAAGLAKGGILTTGSGVVTIPTKEANEFTAPIIGRTPVSPIAVIPLFGQNVPSQTPLITAPQLNQPLGASPGLGGAAGGPVAPSGDFAGAFQAWSKLGTATGPVTRPTGETAPQSIDFSKLPAELRAEFSKLIPAPPKGVAADPTRRPAPGETRPIEAPGGPIQPGSDAAKQIADLLSGITKGQESNPFEKIAAGARVPGGTTPGQGDRPAQLPEGCQQSLVGIVCGGPSGPAADPARGVAPGAAPKCAPGQTPSRESPCDPTPAGTGGPQGTGLDNAFRNLPPCAEGEQPSAAKLCIPQAIRSGLGGTGPANLRQCGPGEQPGPTNPCFQGAPPSPGAGGAPTNLRQCAQGEQPGPTNPCFQGAASSPGAGGAPTTLRQCAPGELPGPTNPCIQAPVAAPTCPPGTTPSGNFCLGAPGPTSAPQIGPSVTCTPPAVLLPDGRCGTPTTTGGGTTPQCIAPQVLLPDGKCGTPTGGAFTPPPSGAFTPPPSGAFTPPPSGAFTPPPSGAFTPPPSGAFTPPPTTGAFTPPPTQQQFTPPPTSAPAPTSNATPPTNPCPAGQTLQPDGRCALGPVELEWAIWSPSDQPWDGVNG